MSDQIITDAALEELPEEYDKLRDTIHHIMEQSFLNGFNSAVDTIAGVLGAESYKESRIEVKRYMQTLALNLAQLKITEEDIGIRQKSDGTEVISETQEGTDQE